MVITAVPERERKVLESVIIVIAPGALEDGALLIEDGAQAGELAVAIVPVEE
jgi:hypothetical protein